MVCNGFSGNDTIFLISSFFLIISCEEGAIDEAVDESVSELPTFETDIPDSLAVYELVDGERVRSTKYRLLTKEEQQKLVDKGALQADGVTLRLFDCSWKDEMEIGINCDTGWDHCGAVSVPETGQVCLACSLPDC